jgi:hypothetical protein
MPEPEIFSERKSSSMMTTGKRNFIHNAFKVVKRIRFGEIGHSAVLMGHVGPL